MTAERTIDHLLNFMDAGNELKLYIRSIRAQNNGERIAVTVSLESGEHSETRGFLLTAGQYYELNLKKGELTEEAFDALVRAARLYGAIRCGENLLSYGSNSVRTLTGKIMRHGYSSEEASEAAAYLASIGLIDEVSDMERELEKCLRKYWGEGRIRSHLWSKGYSKETLELVPELLEQVDFTENCRCLIRKHFGGLPENREERDRMTASLYRYGYRFDEIKRAMRDGNFK